MAFQKVVEPRRDFRRKRTSEGSGPRHREGGPNPSVVVDEGT